MIYEQNPKLVICCLLRKCFGTLKYLAPPRWYSLLKPSPPLDCSTIYAVTLSTAKFCNNLSKLRFCLGQLTGQLVKFPFQEWIGSAATHAQVEWQRGTAKVTTKFIGSVLDTNELFLQYSFHPTTTSLSSYQFLTPYYQSSHPQFRLRAPNPLPALRNGHRSHLHELARDARLVPEAGQNLALALPSPACMLSGIVLHTGQHLTN